MRRYQLIIFDWDGTLSDSASHIVASIQRASHDVGLPVPQEEQARYIIGLGLHDAMEHLFPGLPVARYSEVAERYRVRYFDGAHSIGLFAGVRDGLDELKLRGQRLAVATGKSRSGLDQALVSHGLAKTFDASRCADESLPKPDPPMIHYLLKHFGVQPENALMVGDTTHDLAMAQAAGVDGLGVTYGAHAPELLSTVASLDMLDSPGALWQWLRQNG